MDTPDTLYPSALCGWRGADAVQQTLARGFPALAEAAPHLMTGAAPQQVLLYRVWEEMFLDPNYPAQTIGDCTGFGNSHCHDLLMVLEAYLGGLDQAKIHETCTEFTYATGREVAGILGRSDGGYGAAVVKAMTTIGTLPRGAVGPYSGDRAKQWGYSGAPANLKAEAAAFKVGAAAAVTTTDEAIASLNNGLPFSICSGQGFTMTRDSDGFCQARGSWGHCMFVSAYRTDRPGFLIHQSWGRNTPSGPVALNQPDWTFWCDVPSMAGILGEGDSWALSGSKGFTAQPLPASLRTA
jgi:hypothetical protein